MSEIDDNLEYIFVCEMVLQNPPKGSITTFQRLVDGNGNVTSTQTASIAATATKNWNIVLESGSYTVTGEGVGLGGQYALAAASGSYAVTGTDVNLNHYRMTAESGSYGVTGTDVNLNRYIMTADSGSYAVTGTDVNLNSYKMTAESGSYAMTGTDVELTIPLFYAGGSATVTNNVINMPQGTANGAHTRPLTGKIYFELEATSGINATMIGIGNENEPYDWNASGSNVFCGYRDGTTYGTGSGTHGSFNLTTDRGALAIDVTAKKFWIRDETGSWVDGDPAAGTGGLTFTGSSTEIRAYISNGGSGSGTTEVTVYNSGFSYSVPSGFSALT